LGVKILPYAEHDRIIQAVRRAIWTERRRVVYKEGEDKVYELTEEERVYRKARADVEEDARSVERLQQLNALRRVGTLSYEEWREYKKLNERKRRILGYEPRISRGRGGREEGTTRGGRGGREEGTTRGGRGGREEGTTRGGREEGTTRRGRGREEGTTRGGRGREEGTTRGGRGREEGTTRGGRGEGGIRVREEVGRGRSFADRMGMVVSPDVLRKRIQEEREQTQQTMGREVERSVGGSGQLMVEGEGGSFAQRMGMVVSS
jgi:hypothetical protein